MRFRATDVSSWMPTESSEAKEANGQRSNQEDATCPQQCHSLQNIPQGPADIELIG